MKNFFKTKYRIRVTIWGSYSPEYRKWWLPWVSMDYCGTLPSARQVIERHKKYGNGGVVELL